MFFKLFIFICGFLHIFCLFETMKKLSYFTIFLSEKKDDTFHIFDQLIFTVSNRALPSLHGGSFEIKLTVPLRTIAMH